MRITLNLATRPFADLGPANKRLRMAMAVLAAIAVGLGLGLRALHQKAEVARAREHSLDLQIARIAQERQTYQNMMRQPVNAEVVAQAGTLNQFFDEKAFSWTLAMEDLETVLPGGVQVSTLEPVRAKDGHITLRLHVIGPRDRIVELVRNLEHSRRFLLPRIVGENAESTGGPGESLQPQNASSRVNFDLLAEYNPASPGERKTAKKPSSTTENPDRPPAPARQTVHPPPSFVPIPARLAGRPAYIGPTRPKPSPDSTLGGPL